MGLQVQHQPPAAQQMTPKDKGENNDGGYNFMSIY